MIVGLLPVGGNATRLKLPFPKEILPSKGFDFYKPIMSLVVDKMEDTGVEKIFMVHGLDFKHEIVELFSEDKYIHIQQDKIGFSRVLADFFISSDLADEDKVLFALPDVVFGGNPFYDMLLQDGTVCALFKTFDDCRVDRINQHGKFDVKSPKTDFNSNLFWGAIKFDYATIEAIYDEIDLSDVSEVGDVLNKIGFSTVESEDYLDLGTWGSLNYYWENWKADPKSNL